MNRKERKEQRKRIIRTCPFCTEDEKGVMLEQIEYGMTPVHLHGNYDLPGYEE